MGFRGSLGYVPHRGLYSSTWASECIIDRHHGKAVSTNLSCYFLKVRAACLTDGLMRTHFILRLPVQTPETYSRRGSPGHHTARQRRRVHPRTASRLRPRCHAIFWTHRVLPRRRRSTRGRCRSRDIGRARTRRSAGRTGSIPRIRGARAGRAIRSSDEVEML